MSTTKLMRTGFVRSHPAVKPIEGHRLVQVTVYPPDKGEEWHKELEGLRITMCISDEHFKELHDKEHACVPTAIKVERMKA